MTQNDLNRQVARATGETISTIKHLGFLLDEPPPSSMSTDPDSPQIIDWDALDVQRSQAYSGRDRREPVLT